MRAWKKILRASILVVALTATSFVAGYAFDHFSFVGRLLVDRSGAVFAQLQGGGGEGSRRLNLQPLTSFWEVLQHVRADYVEPTNNDQTLTYGAIRGMLASLDDPYTRFLDPDAYRQFQTETKGEFGGIGAVLGIRKDESGKTELFTIVEIIKGGPADKAGLKPDDVILQINGRGTTGLSLEDAVRMIRGPKGTEVALTLMRKGVELPLEVKIVREMVEVPVVEHKMLDDGMGYLALKQFNDLTEKSMEAALSDLDSKGMKALIVDLRNNPGGLLDSVVEVTSNFVKDKPIVFTRQRRGADEPKMPKATLYRGYDFPMVVLVNHMSASGSEILAAALKDYGLAKLVGTTTYGKGLVQSVFPLSDGSAVLMTTAKYLTPNREDINKKGVVPDEVVEAGGRQLQALSPKELEQAVAHLEGFVAGTSKNGDQARAALAKIRDALGLEKPPEVNKPDVQLEAAETLIRQELARRQGTQVARGSHSQPLGVLAGRR